MKVVKEAVMTDEQKSRTVADGRQVIEHDGLVGARVAGVARGVVMVVGEVESVGGAVGQEQAMVRDEDTEELVEVDVEEELVAEHLWEESAHYEAIARDVIRRSNEAKQDATAAE